MEKAKTLIDLKDLPYGDELKTEDYGGGIGVVCSGRRNVLSKGPYFDDFLPDGAIIHSDLVNSLDIHLSGNKSITVGEFPRLDRLQISVNPDCKVPKNIRIGNGSFMEYPLLGTLRLKNCRLFESLNTIPETLVILEIEDVPGFELSKMPQQVKLLTLAGAKIAKNITVIPKTTWRLSLCDVEHSFQELSGDALLDVYLRSSVREIEKLPNFGLKKIKANTITLSGFHFNENFSVECTKLQIESSKFDYHVIEGRAESVYLRNCVSRDVSNQTVQFIPNGDSIESVAGSNLVFGSCMTALGMPGELY